MTYVLGDTSRKIRIAVDFSTLRPCPHNSHPVPSRAFIQLRFCGIPPLLQLIDSVRQKRFAKSRPQKRLKTKDFLRDGSPHLANRPAKSLKTLRCGGAASLRSTSLHREFPVNLQSTGNLLVFRPQLLRVSVSDRSFLPFLGQISLRCEQGIFIRLSASPRCSNNEFTSPATPSRELSPDGISPSFANYPIYSATSGGAACIVGLDHANLTHPHGVPSQRGGGRRLGESAFLQQTVGT